MDIVIPSGILKGYFSERKKQSKYSKAKIQKISFSDKSMLQISLYTDKQVFHKNYPDEEEAKIAILSLLEQEFNRLEVYTADYIYGYRITSKSKLLTSKKKNSQIFIEPEHNKEKKYIFSEGMIIPPLIDLGVMTPEGKVVKAKYDKFRQINRFLEIINDSIKTEEKLKIIDFGCGKSYLTFILYYFLKVVKHIECDIIGLDLKEDVIDECNQIAEKYGYDSHLKFLKGDISSFKECKDIDMIVTLHACDTATDYALYHAICMKCRYIFSVPCCQHEVNAQLPATYLHTINKFGILKERFSALMTDAIRANILQYSGYKTQVLEFIDFENSPKNLLIRAVYCDIPPNNKIKKELDGQIEQMGIHQTLYDLVFNRPEVKA